MGNGSVANTVLLNEVADSIKDLEADVPGPGEPKCSTRAPVKKGVTTLLKIKQAEMKQNQAQKNSIKFGNITITGTMAIIVVIVAYLFGKSQGWL